MENKTHPVMIFLFIFGGVFALTIINNNVNALIENNDIVPINVVNETQQPQAQIIINKIVYTANNDCMDNPEVSYYVELGKLVRNSQCFKDFMKEVPNDNTIKTKSVVIDVMCIKTQVHKGHIDGTATVNIVNTGIKKQYGEIINRTNGITKIKNDYLLPITIINGVVSC